MKLVVKSFIYDAGGYADRFGLQEVGNMFMLPEVMMKKILLMSSVMILALFSTGCAKTIELTDRENYLIAEYAAELLLKYDRNMDSKYYDDSVSSTLPRPATPQEPDLTEEPDDTGAETGTPGEPDLTEEMPDFGSEITPGELEEVSGVEADAGPDFDIAEYAGEENVSIKYAYYMIVDRYPSYGEDGVYIELEASEGYKLLVLKFDIENKTNDTQNIDMYSKGIEYSIIVNDKKSAKQMLTILIDDLYTYQTMLDGSMREEAVLLFQVSESVADEISNLKLKVDNQDDSRVIQLD